MVVSAPPASSFAIWHITQMVFSWLFLKQISSSGHEHSDMTKHSSSSSKHEGEREKAGANLSPTLYYAASMPRLRPAAPKARKVGSGETEPAGVMGEVASTGHAAAAASLQALCMAPYLRPHTFLVTHGPHSPQSAAQTISHPRTCTPTITRPARHRHSRAHSMGISQGTITT